MPLVVVVSVGSIAADHVRRRLSLDSHIVRIALVAIYQFIIDYLLMCGSPCQWPILLLHNLV